MRRAMRMLVLLITLSACIRTAASPTPTGPAEMHLSTFVAGSRDGPWTPYSHGIHLESDQVWLRIEAN
jgi:hypothetical protein